jgi:hypothetical protein
MEVSRRFYNGLQNYNLTKEEARGWFYCGGDNPEAKSQKHFRNFVKYFGHGATPPHVSYCICGHKIKTNCYITNLNQTKVKNTHSVRSRDGSILPVIILGDCCVERFTDGTKLKCERCNEFIERINKCSKPLCRECKIIWDKGIKLNRKNQSMIKLFK